jgi:hypothetical protein
MPYNFEFAVSATISAKVVEEMIKKVVEEQTGKRVASIQLNMRSVAKGGQLDDYTETVFDGATVIFEKEKATPTPKTKQGTEFVPDTY